VLGGMVTGTFLAIFFIPLFFVIVVKVFGSKRRRVGAARLESALDGVEGK